MKSSKWIWYVVGGIGLVALGVVIGFGLQSTGFGADVGWRVRPMMGAWPGHMVGWRAPGMFFGLRWLLMLLFWVGPLAGIIALILVLTRRSAPPAAPTTVVTTTSEETRTE